MTGRLFFDTNILVYALDQSEPAKRPIAVEWLRQARGSGGLILNPQVLNECYWVVGRKMPTAPRTAVRDFVGSLFEFCVAPLDRQTIAIGWTLQDRLDYSWWDCLLLASALQSECSMFVTEDLAAGQSVGSLTIVNPFLPESVERLRER